MGKSSPSPPAPPDPVATARAQAAANKEAAIASQELSMVDQYTPYGNLVYSPIGESAAGTPRYSATQAFSPSQQALYDLGNETQIRFGQIANQQINNVAGRFNTPFTISNGATGTAGGGGTGGGNGGQIGAVRTIQERVEAPEFVPPTAGEGVGGTRMRTEEYNTPVDETGLNAAHAAVKRAEASGTDPVTGQTLAQTWEALHHAKNAYNALYHAPGRQGTREVEQTFTDQGWIDTADLPEGWQAAPTPEQIEAARIQWLLDNPLTYRDVSQTYTPDGWVNTDTLPSGWGAPQQPQMAPPGGASAMGYQINPNAPVREWDPSMGLTHDQMLEAEGITARPGTGIGSQLPPHLQGKTAADFGVTIQGNPVPVRGPDDNVWPSYGVPPGPETFTVPDSTAPFSQLSEPLPTAAEYTAEPNELGAYDVGYGTGLPPLPIANEATRRETRDSIIDRMQPMMERDRAALETRLMNQGIQYGSRAWMAAMDDFNRAQTDMRLAADAAAGNEMAMMYGLAANARDRGVNEYALERNQPLNELAALLSMSPVQAPSFVNTPMANIAAPDIGGYTYGSYNGAMNAYNANMANRSANTQGLYGLLGTGLQAGAYMWGGPAAGAAAGAATRR